MKKSINKKIVILLSMSVISTSLMSDNFSWSDYKKSLPSSIIEQNSKSKSERTKNNIKKHLDVDVERRTLAEIRREQNSKNLTISAIFRNQQTWETGGVAAIPGVSDGIDPVENKTSQIGVSISGRFDLMSIGKKLPDTYATIDVFEDNIWIGISRRIQGDDRLGLFSDIGAGLFFQMQETVREQDMYMYAFFKLGYNFKDWNIKAGVNIPSDSFGNGFFDSTQFNISVGWRF